MNTVLYAKNCNYDSFNYDSKKYSEIFETEKKIYYIVPSIDFKIIKVWPKINYPNQNIKLKIIILSKCIETKC